MANRWLSLIGAVTALMVSTVLNKAFGVGVIGIVVGCLVAAAVLVLIDRNGNGPVGAIVFVLLAAVAFVVVIVQQFRAVGWGTALAIDVPIVAVIVLAVWFTGFGRHRMTAARLSRRAIEGTGWRYRRPDAELLHRVRLAFPRARNRVRTLYPAIEGSVDGVELVFVNGRSAPQAWLVRLPFALPRAAVGAGGRTAETGGGDAYRQALLTPAVVDATVAGGATGWRIERDDLVVEFGPAGGPDAIRRDAAQVAGLARALPLTELHRYAIDPSALADPAEWAIPTANRRGTLRTAAALGIVLAVLVLACGLLNVGTPGHRLASLIMLGASGGTILLGVLILVLVKVPRGAQPAVKPARADTATVSKP